MIFSTWYAWHQHKSNNYPGKSNISPPNELICARSSLAQGCHQSKQNSPPKGTNNFMAAKAGPHTHPLSGQAPLSHSGGSNSQIKISPRIHSTPNALPPSRALNISNIVDGLSYQKLTLKFHQLLKLLKSQLELLLLKARTWTRTCLLRNLLRIKLHSVDRVSLLKAKAPWMWSWKESGWNMIRSTRCLARRWMAMHDFPIFENDDFLFINLHGVGLFGCGW